MRGSLLLAWVVGCSAPALRVQTPEATPTTPPDPAPVVVHERTEQALDAADETDVAEAFWRDFWNQAFDEASGRMDAKLAASLPPHRLRAVWSSLERRLGKPLRYEPLDVVLGESRTHTWYVTEYERGSWLAEVVVNPAGRVSGLRLVPAPGPWTVPSYADPGSFSERSFSVGTPPLEGTLTVPAKAVRQAVVLVHGSGPQDQDASTGPGGMGSKIFKDLAWGLASRGIAVVRYPKRTWAQPEYFEGTALTLDEEVTMDACDALKSLQRALPGARVSVVGHSLGAAMAPRIAARCPGVSGLVLMAGPSRALDDVLFDQLEYLLPMSKSRMEVADGLSELLAGFAIASLPTDFAREEVVFSGMRGPKAYFSDVDRYQPLQELTRAPKLPMLVMQGGRDYQVTVKDFDGWKRALRGHRAASFRYYPALDHRFIEGRGPSLPTDEGGHVAGEAVADMASWLRASGP